MTSTTQTMSPQIDLKRAFMRYVGVVPLLIVLCFIIMAFVEPRFFSRINLLNTLRNASFLSMIALGQTLVMLVGGFDLSIGAVVALSSITVAMSMAMYAGIFADSVWLVAALGVSTALLAGTLVGLINGVIVSRLKLVPFMVTLAMASVVLGTTFFISKGVPIYGMPREFVNNVGRADFLGLSYPIWTALLTIIVLGFVLERTAFGRHIYAVGGNAKAARASGLKIEPVLLFAYGAAGFIGAMVGILLTARIGSGQSTLDGTLAIESIAAAIVGGVSLKGGIGRVHRVVYAAIFLSVLSNMLNLARVDSKFQTMALGIAVLVAALAELRLARRENDE